VHLLPAQTRGCWLKPCIFQPVVCMMPLTHFTFN